MEARQLALRCSALADGKKAEDIVILDVQKLSSVTDYFVIATGTSEPHLRALVEEITGVVREEYGLRPRASDGTAQNHWVVLDYFDVIVHVMRGDTRAHYDLESLWGDARRVRVRRAAAPRRTRTPKAKVKADTKAAADE